MTTFIALLRAINLGSHNPVAMADLRGIGRSRLTNALLEKRLGVRGTARNWNTVLKLAALVKGPRVH